MKSLTTLAVFICLVIGQSSEIEQTSALIDALLKRYNKDAKPDGQVEVRIGLNLITLELCPHRQVGNCFRFYLVFVFTKFYIRL